MSQGSSSPASTPSSISSRVNSSFGAGARGGAHVFRCGRGTEAVSGGKSGMDARDAATGAVGTVDTNLRILQGVGVQEPRGIHRRVARFRAPIRPRDTAGVGLPVGRRARRHSSPRASEERDSSSRRTNARGWDEARARLYRRIGAGECVWTRIRWLDIGSVLRSRLGSSRHSLCGDVGPVTS